MLYVCSLLNLNTCMCLEFSGYYRLSVSCLNLYVATLIPNLMPFEVGCLGRQLSLDDVMRVVYPWCNQFVSKKRTLESWLLYVWIKQETSMCKAVKWVLPRKWISPHLGLDLGLVNFLQLHEKLCCLSHAVCDGLLVAVWTDQIRWFVINI